MSAGAVTQRARGAQGTARAASVWATARAENPRRPPAREEECSRVGDAILTSEGVTRHGKHLLASAGFIRE